MFLWGIYSGAVAWLDAYKVRCYAVFRENGGRSWVEQGLGKKVGVVRRGVSREFDEMTGGCGWR